MIVKKILVGSSAFFSHMPGFKSKDIDYVWLVDNPVGFKNFRQTSSSVCIFEWRNMSNEEFVQYALMNASPAMQIGKFLVKEFAMSIGLTIDQLQSLRPLVDSLDDKHLYERIIFNSIIENGNWDLTEVQLDLAYAEYKRYRR